MNPLTKWRAAGPLLLILLVSNFLVLRYINYRWPFVGHDFYYILPRLIDIQLHYLINGFSIQWYSPSLGGGLPSFPNPISTQFSLPQFLYMALDLWTSIQTTILLTSSIGIFFVYKLIERWTEDRNSATLGALFYALNGFTLNHLMAGHLFYHLFYFAPLLLYVFSLDPVRPFLIIATTAFVYALSLHSAGVQVLVAVNLTLVLCALFFTRLGLRGRDGWIRLGSWGAGVVLALLISAAKLNAALSFMRYFPRTIESTVAPSVGSGLQAIFYQLLGYPFFSMFGWTANELAVEMNALSGSGFGLWEHDVHLPLPLFLILALFVLFLTFGRGPSGIFESWWKERRAHAGTLVAAFLALWITLEMILAQGPFFSVLKSLPILKSLHVNMRFTSALILPLVFASALAFSKLSRRWVASERGRALLTLLLALASVGQFLFYENRNKEEAIQTYQIELSLKTEELLKKGERFVPVSQVGMIRDDAVFALKASSLKPYEPIFGYQLEALKSEVKEGSSVAIDQGAFNMTNPASLVFPEENGLRIFERISTQDEANMKAFILRQQPNWKVSERQNLANDLSLLGLILFVAVLGAHFFFYRIHRADRAS